MTSVATSASRRLWLRAWFRSVAKDLLHVDALTLGHHPLGLLDDDAGVEGAVELLVQGVRFSGGAVLEYRNRGHVGEGLSRVHVSLTHGSRLGVEKVERADDPAPQPHRQSMDGVEAGGERLGREARPPVARGDQVLVDHRLTGAEAVQARAVLRLDLEQLEHAHGLARGGHHPQVAVGRGQHQTGGADVEHVHTAVGQQRQQLHDVEVGDERVRQLHERPGKQGFSGHRLSNHDSFGPRDRAGCARADPREIVGRSSSASRLRVLLAARRVEAERSGHDVSRNLGQGTVVSEGVGPETDERLTDRDVELHGDHPGGLMDHILKVSTRVELGGDLPDGRLGLQEKDCLRGDVGHHEGVGVLLAVEGSRSVSIEVEGAEPYGADTEGKSEHGPHSRVEGGSGEREPAGVSRVGEVGFEHGSLELMRVHTRSFAQVVLQLFDERAHLISGAHRAPRNVPPHQHDACARHTGDLRAHAAEPGSLCAGRVTHEPIDDPLPAFAEHYLQA